MGGLQAHLPTPRWAFKNSMTPYSPNLAQATFFCLFPQMKKFLKGKSFTGVEEMKQKNGRITRHQNQPLQKLFWAVEKKSQ